MKKFIDRKQAGSLLAEALETYRSHPSAQILALPRGGVPVAYEVAKALMLPLDVFIVRKLGLPGHEELAIGALASGGVSVFNEKLIQTFHISASTIDSILQEEGKELARRENCYRANRPFPALQDKTVILIDDGIATGATMQTAIKGIRQHQPEKIIVAVPVAAASTCEELAPLVDELICLLKPLNFYAVGLWYEAFLQTTDQEVIDLLKQANPE